MVREDKDSDLTITKHLLTNISYRSTSSIAPTPSEPSSSGPLKRKRPGSKDPREASAVVLGVRALHQLHMAHQVLNDHVNMRGELTSNNRDTLYCTIIALHISSQG